MLSIREIDPAKVVAIASPIGSRKEPETLHADGAFPRSLFPFEGKSSDAKGRRSLPYFPNVTVPSYSPRKP
jgi:hypothetical protein